MCTQEGKQNVFLNENSNLSEIKKMASDCENLKEWKVFFMSAFLFVQV